MKFITTSWDDGHPLDFKLADLLAKYDVPATFYIPRENSEHTVMSEDRIRELSQGFEIGGHTLHHKRLYSSDSVLLQAEVKGSFLWLQDLLGRAPVSFCFPGGVFTRAAVAAAFECGYTVARTTELLSTSPAHDGALMPTTLQLYPHSSLTYVKHLIKRQKWTNLSRFARAPFKKNLQQLATYYLDTLENGDCFHLWGHSWELQEQGLWQKLEEVLRVISNRPDFTYIVNGQLPSLATKTNY